jgi:ribosomal protein S18 acetylase RimI-like enzyme
MKIRRANLRDAKIIERLNKKYFREKGRDWRKLISSKDSEAFVLELHKKIIGFTGLQYQKWNNTAQIIDIFIHPFHRQRGYGTKLVKFLIKYLKNKNYRSLIAEAPSLSPALVLYLKNNFRICGFNDRYYSNKGKEIAIFLSYDFK